MGAHLNPYDNVVNSAPEIIQQPIQKRQKEPWNIYVTSARSALNHLGSLPVR
jgi:hypothetical protein